MISLKTCLLGVTVLLPCLLSPLDPMVPMDAVCRAELCSPSAGTAWLPHALLTVQERRLPCHWGLKASELELRWDGELRSGTARLTKLPTANSRWIYFSHEP